MNIDKFLHEICLLLTEQYRLVREQNEHRVFHLEKQIFFSEAELSRRFNSLTNFNETFTQTMNNLTDFSWRGEQEENSRGESQNQSFD